MDIGKKGWETVHIMIPKELKEKIKKDANTQHRTFGNFITYLLIQHYDYKFQNEMLRLGRNKNGTK